MSDAVSSPGLDSGLRAEFCLSLADFLQHEFATAACYKLCDARLTVFVSIQVGRSSYRYPSGTTGEAHCEQHASPAYP
jgi:hypothetical protein